MALSGATGPPHEEIDAVLLLNKNSTKGSFQVGGLARVNSSL
jgi:hypothetical protein